jgi:aminobenzoyl-glutamate utilization protein B
VISPTVLLLAAALADGKDAVSSAIEAKRAAWAATALEIWRCAEVGYQETKSSALLQSELRAAGFQVEAGLAGMPTAFRASWGRGKPVIAFLAEFDALPGLSQEAVPEHKTAGAPAGHGCGHHLLGTASTAAGIAVKDWLASTGGAGTVRVYGTPAEEGGGGKVYLLRAGLFDDVDAVLAWHPGDVNDASPRSSLANISAKFRFHGVSAHAAGAPERGRSALDAVEAMDHMVNLMREHIPQETRVHYVITRGGEAPNVVPDFAEVYYYARHPDVTTLDEIWERILKAADGAALGTGTTVDHEVIHAVFNLLPNERLARLMDANLRRVGGYRYTPEEAAFAERLSRTLTARRALGSQEQVQAMVAGISSSSTDLGDVSWVVPTAEMTAATWVPGTPAHSWQATAAGGTSIGVNGMIVAAKTLALTALDLFQDPEQVKAARAELAARQGPGFRYRPRVGDRPPPLDYRK